MLSKYVKKIDFLKPEHETTSLIEKVGFSFLKIINLIFKGQK